MTGDDDEARFLETYDATAFPKPSIAVDVVLLGIAAEALRTLVIRRHEHPEMGRWALPGGFVRMDESLDAAAARILAGKAGIEGVFLEQLYTFGRPDRDPRMRIVSVAYYALVQRTLLERTATQADARLHTIAVDDLGDDVSLAFDHREIIATAVKRLRGKITYAPVGYELLPPEFTLFQLQRVHEIILGRRLNKDSFRRRMLATGELEPTGSFQDGVDYRPAALYRRALPLQGETDG